MPLVCLFDSIDNNTLRFTTDYLSEKFEDTRIISYDPNDSNCIPANDVGSALEIAKKVDAEIILTNHLQSVPQLIDKYPTLVWLTDRTGGPCIKRQDNVAFWRQTMGLLRSVPNIFTASQFMAKQILNNYRLPCKVQSIYIPPQLPNQSNVVYYNVPPLFLHQLKELMPDQQFVKIQGYEDYKQAKLYIHVATGLEYSNIDIPIAATYGVPCIIEDLGCLNEYVTTGDKLLPLGSDWKTWVQAFKFAIRDRDVHSETVRKLSYRYSQMSEFEERIKAALKKQGKPVRAPTFHEAQAIAAKRTRPMPAPVVEKKKPIKPQITFSGGLPQDEVNKVRDFVSNNNNMYFGCGGMGDALLTIASCYHDPAAKVVFGANHGGVKLMFDAFKIPVMTTRNLYPSVLGHSLHQFIITHANFRGAAHIPDSMNYGEWIIDPQKYLNRLNKRMPMQEIFGKLVNPRATNGIVGISPRGSDHNGAHKQRFLSVDEFNKLTRKYLDQNLTVIAFGSPADVEHYKVIKNNNFLWMTSEFGVSYPAPQYPMSMRHMLSAVNSCDLIISVDTWLKTYGGLAGIPTKVIMSRRNGQVLRPPQDSSDYIFMDAAFWGFELVSLHQLFE